MFFALLSGVAVMLLWATAVPLVVVLALVLILVVVHEFGHFAAAKTMRVAVSEFAVGFGPVVASTTTAKMRWSLRAIPLGGFVRIVGMDDIDSELPSTSGRSYRDVGLVGRLWIAFAGPAANVVFALLVASTAAMFHDVKEVNPAADVVVHEGSLAEVAGMETGDQITSIDGVAVEVFADIPALLDSAVSEMAVTVQRADGTIDNLVVEVPSTGERLGITQQVVSRSINPVEAVTVGGRVVGDVIVHSGQALAGIGSGFVNIPKQLLFGSEPDDSRLVSPVGVAQVAPAVVEEAGWLGGVVLVVHMSVFIGLFNLLPIPPLDGGHMAVAAVNSVTRRVRGRDAISRNVAQGVGVAVGLLLAVAGICLVVLDLVRPVAG